MRPCLLPAEVLDDVVGDDRGEAALDADRDAMLLEPPEDIRWFPESP